MLPLNPTISGKITKIVDASCGCKARLGKVCWHVSCTVQIAQNLVRPATCSATTSSTASMCLWNQQNTRSLDPKVRASSMSYMCRSRKRRRLNGDGPVAEAASAAKRVRICQLEESARAVHNPLPPGVLTAIEAVSAAEDPLVAELFAASKEANGGRDSALQNSTMQPL